jgi:hypothetical protein
MNMTMDSAQPRPYVWTLVCNMGAAVLSSHATICNAMHLHKHEHHACAMHVTYQDVSNGYLVPGGRVLGQLVWFKAGQVNLHAVVLIAHRRSDWTQHGLLGRPWMQ